MSNKEISKENPKASDIEAILEFADEPKKAPIGFGEMKGWIRSATDKWIPKADLRTDLSMADWESDPTHPLDYVVRPTQEQPQPACIARLKPDLMMLYIQNVIAPAAGADSEDDSEISQDEPTEVAPKDAVEEDEPKKKDKKEAKVEKSAKGKGAKGLTESLAQAKKDKEAMETALQGVDLDKVDLEDGGVESELLSAIEAVESMASGSFDKVMQKLESLSEDNKNLLKRISGLEKLIKDLTKTNGDISAKAVRSEELLMLALDTLGITKDDLEDLLAGN